MSIIDSSPKPKTVTLNNGASVSNLKGRFGGASLYLNGSNQYATIAEDTDFGLGTGDFTIEMWVYPLDQNNWRSLIALGQYNNGLLWRIGTNNEQLYFNGTSWNWGATSVPLNSWSHLALVRNNGTIKVFINGTESLSISGGAAAGDLGSAKAVFLGAHSTNYETFNGYIDEVRITKGVGSAKYTSNFDVKTLYAPFPSSGTPVTPPNAPTDLVAGPLDSTINMIWNTPADDNGGIITDYSIQYSTDGSNWTDFPHSPSVVTAVSVTGLTNGTNYSVRVGAINYTGVQNYVSESNIMPAVPPVDTNPDPYFYNTSLLLHFDGAHNSTTITDTSYLPKSGSVQGDAKLSIARNKFGGSSIYFDGNGDYLTVPNHPGFDFYNEDFTIEYWEYRTDSSNVKSVMCRINNGYTPFLIGYSNGSRVRAYFCQDPNYDNWNIANDLDMGAISLNAWVHYAVVRQGNTIRTYQNGVQIATTTSSATIAVGNGPLNIGRYSDTHYYQGYLDDIRITRGVCRYPDGTTFSIPALPFSDVAPTITVPTAPSNVTATGGDATATVSWTGSSSDKTIRANYSLEYSEDTDPKSWTTVNTSNTRLLLHFNKGEIRGNASLVDSSLYGREVLWNPSSPAMIGGSSSPGTYQKFGTGCLEIPYNRTGYTSPYITKVAESSDLNPGTGDYTLEMFIMSDTQYSNGLGRLFGSYNGSNGSYFSLYSSGGNCRISKYVNGSEIYGKTFTSNELRGNTDWYGVGNYNQPLKHLVFCRNNGTMRIYLNGARVLETADINDDNFSNNGLVIMGGESGSHNPNNYVLGRMDELRYTVGEALYTGSSIDLLPSAEFKNAKITGIPNDKNYVFRIRGQNSAGYGDYSSESSPTLVAPPPSLSIALEPLNTRVETYNSNAVFSVSGVMSDASSVTYQWQRFSYSNDPCNDYWSGVSRSWQNIDGATNSSVTINGNSFPSCWGDPTLTGNVRCILSSPYETKVSKVVKYVDISSIFTNFYTYHFESYIDANYRPTYEFNTNSLGYYYYEGTIDDSGHTGNDTRLVYEFSSNNTSWTRTDPSYNIEFRRQTWANNGYQYLQVPPIDLSGTVYVRLVLEDMWPYNTTNGSLSSTESLYSVAISTVTYEMNATPPNLPTNFVALGGNELVALSWTKGHSGGQPSTATYTVEYSTDDTNWTTFTSTLPFNNSGVYVTGLTNNTQYYFRLKVINSIGETSWTSTVTATPNLSAAVAPSAPTDLLSIAGDGRAYLAWNLPSSDGRSPLTDYNIQYSTDNGITWTDYIETP